MFRIQKLEKRFVVKVNLPSLPLLLFQHQLWAAVSCVLLWKCSLYFKYVCMFSSYKGQHTVHRVLNLAFLFNHHLRNHSILYFELLHHLLFPLNRCHNTQTVAWECHLGCFNPLPLKSWYSVILYICCRIVNLSQC